MKTTKPSKISAINGERSARRKSPVEGMPTSTMKSTNALKSTKSRSILNGERRSQPLKASKTLPQSPQSSKKETAKKSKKEKNSKEKIEQIYEENFEDYESDFESDEDETKDSKDSSLGQSVLLQKLANRTMESYSKEYATASKSALSNARPVTALRRVVISSPRKGSLTQLGNESTRSDRSEQSTGLQRELYQKYYQAISARNATKVEIGLQTGTERQTIGTQSEQFSTVSVEIQTAEITINSTKSNNLTVKMTTVDSNQTNAFSYKVIRPVADLRRLHKFVDAATQAMIGLLASDRQSHSQNDTPLMQNNSNVMFSSRYSTFNCFPPATKSQLQCLCFPSASIPSADKEMPTISTNKSNTVIAGVFIVESSEGSMHRKSFLFEYDYSNDRNRPSGGLICEGEVTCCCCTIAADGCKIVAAGLTDGSCVAWCLDESNTFTESLLSTTVIRWQNENIPTIKTHFDSSYRSVALESHSSFLPNKEMTTNGTVISIHPVGNEGDTFVTLQARGIIVVWSVLISKSIGHVNEQSGSSHNFIATRIIDYNKLINRQNPTLRIKRLNSIRVTCLEPIPQNSSFAEPRFLLGFECGLILLIKGRDTNGGGFIQRQYGTTKKKAFDICCMRISSFDNEIFAAGQSDSRILLYHINRSIPIRVLAAPEMSFISSAVTHIEWSFDVSHAFYAVYGESHVVVWQIYGAQARQPFSREICDFKSEFEDKISTMTVCTAHASRYYMAFGLKKSGNVAVHNLERISKLKNDKTLRQLLGLPKD